MSRRILSLFVLVTALLLNPLQAADRLDLPALQQAQQKNLLLLSVEKSGDRLVAAGEHGVIIFSDDQGEHWQQAEVPSSALLTSLHFFDNQSGWAVGHDGLLLQTQDAGAHWQKRLDGDQINQLRVAAIEQTLEQLNRAEEPDQERIEMLEYKLDDASVALEEGPSSPLLDVLFISPKRGFLIGAYGLLLATDDGGENWHSVGHQLPNPDGLHLNRIFQTSRGELLLLGEAGLVLNSLDAGASWNVVDTPYQGSFFSAAESDALYLMGLRGNTYRRLPDLSWGKVELPVTATINDAVVVDGQAYLVGQGGALLQQQGSAFVKFSARGLRSYSAVTAINGYLLIVGEEGVKRIRLDGVTEHE